MKTQTDKLMEKRFIVFKKLVDTLNTSEQFNLMKNFMDLSFLIEQKLIKKK